MLVNMFMLAEDLSDLETYQEISSLARQLTISHAELFDPHADPEEGVVYLATPRDLTQAPPARGGLSIICLGQAPLDLMRQLALDFVIVDADISMAALLARVQRSFQTYERWNDQLGDVLLRQGGVADLLAATMPIVRANLLVHDRDLRTIAYRAHDVDEDGPLGTLRQNEPFSDDVVASFSKSVETNLGSESPFSVKGPHFWAASLGTTSLGMNIFLNDRFVARVAFVTTDKGRQPTERDVGIIVTLCKYIRAVLSTSFSAFLGSGRSALSDVLVDMLEGRSVTKSALESAAHTRLWDHRRDEYLLLVAQTPSSEALGTNARYPFVSIFSRIAEMIPESNQFFHDGCGISLVNLTRSRLNTRKALGIFERIARESHCSFGVGRSFHGLRHIKQAHHAAVISLRHGSASAHDDRCAVARIDDVILEFVDSCILEHMPAVSFCPESLVALVHYDNVHRSQLYPTVRAYVECNCSSTKSARELFIQRSTFQYRYERAMQILGCNLDDPNVQLTMRLAFRLLDTLPTSEFESI